MNEFVCTEVRFKFWNGKKTYSAEYCPGLRTWYVFDEETTTNCLAKYELVKKTEIICYQNAATYLEKYFKSINSEAFVIMY